jgi:hypothetical protein
MMDQQTAERNAMVQQETAIAVAQIKAETDRMIGEVRAAYQAQAAMNRPQPQRNANA